MMNQTEITFVKKLLVGVLTLAIGLVVVVVRPEAFLLIAALVAFVGVLEALGWILRPLRSAGRPPKR